VGVRAVDDDTRHNTVIHRPFPSIE